VTVNIVLHMRAIRLDVMAGERFGQTVEFLYWVRFGLFGFESS
jgi:hypothetical protein